MAEIALGVLALAAGLILLGIYLLGLLTSGAAQSKGVTLDGPAWWVPVAGIALLVIASWLIF